MSVVSGGTIMVKKITDEQILGEKGINLIQSIVLDMGFTWHSSNQAVEAGIDGWIELRHSETGEVANSWLPVQSRARTQLREDETTVKYTCTVKDAEYWLQGGQPVILIVSKPEERVAWWVSVKDYLRGKDVKKDRLIVFDKIQDRLTASTGEDWKVLGNRYGSGAYFSPQKTNETLSSNLIRVSRVAPIVYRARTQCTTPHEVKDALRKVIEWPSHEWCLGNSSQILSFHNLAESPWNQVCENATVTTVPTDTLAYSDDREEQRGYVQLLNGCLRQLVGMIGMRHSTENDCYYFSPSKSSIVRELQYKSRKKKTSRMVVEQYLSKADSARVAYYRHDAFSHRFLRFRDCWFLMIEPTYVFTIDGKSPDPYREEHLSKIKAIEGDAAVSGKIYMFADIFRDRESLFDKPYAFLGFEGVECAAIDVGIDDEAWARIKAQSETEGDRDESDSFGEGLFE